MAGVTLTKYGLNNTSNSSKFDSVDAHLVVSHGVRAPASHLLDLLVRACAGALRRLDMAAWVRGGGL